MMESSSHLERFKTAQVDTYDTALAEIKNGQKSGHWMWFIFPQLEGLGESQESRFYGIRDLDEAKAYLNDELLGSRLLEISNAVLKLTTDDPQSVLGSPDDIKLRSSMTLFSLVPDTDPVFKAVLDKFFHGEKDDRTIALLEDL